MASLSRGQDGTLTLKDSKRQGPKFSKNLCHPFWWNQSWWKMQVQPTNLPTFINALSIALNWERGKFYPRDIQPTTFFLWPCRVIDLLNIGSVEEWPPFWSSVTYNNKTQLSPSSCQKHTMALLVLSIILYSLYSTYRKSAMQWFGSATFLICIFLNL